MIIFNQPISIQREFAELVQVYTTRYSSKEYTLLEYDELITLVQNTLTKLFLEFEQAYNNDRNHEVLNIYVKITALSFIYESINVNLKLNEEQELLKELVEFTPYELIN